MAPFPPALLFSAPLLQAGLHWPTLGTVLLWLLASAAALEKVYGWIFGGTGRRLAQLEATVAQFTSREALEKRFADLENRHKIVAADVANQHNTLHEYERERERLKGVFDGAIKQLQKDMTALEPMPGRVANLEAKFDTLNERIGSLKEGQQEMKENMKDTKREILDAIAKITH